MSTRIEPVSTLDSFPALEQTRLTALLEILPTGRSSILEIGARGGYVTRLLLDRFDAVTALDLEQPEIEHERVTPVRGDVTELEFPDGAFDVVLCSEVLEHIDPGRLPAACAHLARVARHEVVIGVPFDQDTRVGRLTCQECGAINPPFGHVNRFTEERLLDLFRPLRRDAVAFAGETRDRTNPLSTLLLDRAGNPWGTYTQQEGCGRCGAAMRPPDHRTPVQRVFSATAMMLNRVQQLFTTPRPRWIHVRFSKPDGPRSEGRPGEVTGGADDGR